MADLPISKVEVGLSMDWGVKGLDYVYKSSYNEKKVRPCDLQTLMIDVSLHRAKRVEGEIEPLATRISNRNDTLDALGTALADLTKLQAKFDSEAEGGKGEQVTAFKWQLLDSYSAEPKDDDWEDPAADGSITCACADKTIIVANDPDNRKFKAGKKFFCLDRYFCLKTDFLY